MNCKCGAHTRVVSSRPHADDPSVIVRRRHCKGCGKRFNTYESTWDVVTKRERDRASKARNADGVRERDRARWQRRKLGVKLRREARAEAAETNRPLAEVMKAYGLTPSTHWNPM